jgi:hypothetical protein
MLYNNSSITMLEVIAKETRLLQDLDIIFVGGATTCLYIDDETLGQIRNTNDVDCTVGLTSFIHYSRMEDMLRLRGFKNVIAENAPICRWSFKGILVDIMPDEEHIIGFTNSWYKEGRKQKISIALPSRASIFIFPVEYFLASKIEAFNKRGNNDFYGSKDIEDIITVFDGTLQLQNIFLKKNNAVEFVIHALKDFCKDQNFIQSLTGHIEFGDTRRAERILFFIQSL